jgi:hypothetical protein
MRKQLPRFRCRPAPLDVTMPIEQALSPDDLSAMRILNVPDVWPPVESPQAAGLPRQQQAGFTRSDCGLGQPTGDGRVWPRQFAVLLAEALAGDRPARQIQPYLSRRGTAHLQRLLPLFCDGHGARVQRVMTTQPSPDVIEMTLIVAVGGRIRALAVRLTLGRPDRRPGWQQPTAVPPATVAPRWLCTDIEAA